MEKFTSLTDYLNELRACNDPALLKDRFKIYDNFHILLYGNADDLFSRVASAFKSLELGEKWYQEPLESDDLFFHNTQAMGHIHKGPYHPLTEEEDRINGENHSAWVMFHSYKTSMGNLANYALIASAVAHFGDYIIRERLTARFPMQGLKFNYVPL
ncbi:MAG: hypothetical protein Q7K45_02205 [Nanoarchaeota archaeon]|nr:hypothetical protein [Nanoarchaeota archaeon]